MVAKKTTKQTEVKKEAILNKKALVDFLYDRAVKWGEKYDIFPKTTEIAKRKYSEKAKKASEIIDKGNFGCQHDAVRSLVAEIIDESLPPSKKENAKNIEYELKLVLFILSDPKSEKLPVGEVVLVKNFGSACGAFITMKGKESTISNSSRTSIRIPSKNEIEDFIDNLGEEKLTNILFNI